jgi:hypothetical protein
MWVTINKNTSVEEFDKILLSMQPPALDENSAQDEILFSSKPEKLFHSEMFLGKVKWGEDGMEYMKKIRNEWD